MDASAAIARAKRGNADWDRRPSPIPHTTFEQPCINFVNSEFLDHVGSGRRYDRLVLPEWRRWFLGRIGLPPRGGISEAELAELAAVRRRLRRLLESGRAPAPADVAEFNRILRAARLIWTVTVLRETTSPRLKMRLVTVDRGWRAALGLIVSSYADLVTGGELSRVKRCGNRHCCYLFFDSTRNATRRWCDPHACGNLVKVRQYRSRRAVSG